MKIGRTWRGCRADAALSMPSRFQAELACRRAVEDPRRQIAVRHDRASLTGNTLGIEGMRAQSANPQGIIDDDSACGKQALAELVSEEARLARDCAAVDGRREMPDQRAGGTRIEHDRHAASGHLARIEAFDRSLAGGTTDRLGRL